MEAGKEKGNRKLISQTMHIRAALAVIIPYFIIMACLKQAPDVWVVGLALVAVGGDAVAVKLANAIGDHGAFKKAK